MDIEKLRSFITVARLGSISAAADELYLSSSAVSKHISSLENELGLTLFCRGQKKILLNDAGEICLVRAEKIYAEYNHLLIELSASSTINIVSIPAQGFLASYLSTFERLHPQITISMTDRHGPEIIRAVKNGEFELAIAGSPYVDTEYFDCFPIKWSPLGLVVSKNHPLAGSDSVSISRLKDEKFYFMSSETGLYDYYRNICLDHGFEPCVVGLRSREDTILSFVSNGGATLMTSHSFSCYSSPQLCYIPLKEQYFSGPMLIKKKDSVLSKKAKILWDFFAANN